MRGSPVMAIKRRNRKQVSTPSTLSYPVRVRDLVHGYVYLTDLEVRVINHPLFQRLRHIRQNDVASYVYPSLNISRFEHSLGCTHVAGKMAANLTRSPEWSAYQRALDLDTDEFEQTCRLYALLHDVGHLPLSHIFEMAFEDYAHATRPGISLVSLCCEWFGGSGFTKLHEACGSALASTILKDTQVPLSIGGVVLHLMTSKTLHSTHPHRPIKQLVDSEVDADRIDSTARDGLLAGGEYGSYDIERLCSSVFVQRYDKGWRLAYSHKALGSIEALLLDRCRTHTWIHFHHRVVAMKAAACILIGRLLNEAVITSDSFPVKKSKVMCLRDDIWLWSLLREMEPRDDPAVNAARDALLYRDKSVVTLLWKNRSVYRLLQEDLRRSAELREEKLNNQQLGRDYERKLTRMLGNRTLAFWLKFQPVGDHVVPLTGEDGQAEVGELGRASALVGLLEKVWEKEPQYYVIILGKPRKNLDMLRQTWIETTTEWIRRS